MNNLDKVLDELEKIVDLLEDEEDNKSNSSGSGDEKSKSNNKDKQNKQDKNSKGKGDKQDKERDDKQDDDSQGNDENEDRLKDLENKLNSQDSGGNGEDGEDEEDSSSSLTGKVNFRGTEIDLGDFNVDLKHDTHSINKTDKKLERELSEMARAAFEDSKRAGKGHCSMERFFEELEKATPPNWTALLNPYLRPDLSVKYSWNKAHKNRVTRLAGYKLLQQGSVKPPVALKQLLIAIDTSGSITDEQLSIFYSQVKGFLDVRPHVKGHVCYWDTRIANSGEFRDYKTFSKVAAKGGGGTDVECVFEYAKENELKYLVIFTDGYCDFPKNWKDKFACVLWVIPVEEDYRTFMKREDIEFGLPCTS